MGSRPHPAALTSSSFRTGLEAGEAARLIVSHVQPLPAERRSLRDALDLVSAEPVISPIDLPPWDNSAMDGYACRAADARAGAVLRIVESVAAGEQPARAIGPGEAARVFTGAPIPAGADGVIRQEDVDAEGGRGGRGGRVTIRDARDAGKNVRPRAEDIKAGQTVLAAGVPLGPAQLGVLASIAHEPVAVHRPPVVAFVASGDEITGLDGREDILAGRRIASSNSYTLFGMIAETRGVPRDLGLTADRRDALRGAFERAMEGGVDLLLTTAGVSVGEHDLVRSVLVEMGCEMKLWRVRIRPGGPLGFGMLGDLPWIGLPGNPVSTMVTFELFVRPAIRRLLGHARPYRRPIPVVVEERI
ncbi:MAG TPA: gephyrin-like molybdotransferase Glp, partial [Gemmatimonadales bacterium]|nr:gephyrin-like molybdotransferase Glp [Gemmatimonadales bacterium]